MADRTHPHDTSTPAMSAETVPSEEAAKLVYEAMVWARDQQPGAPVPKWIDGGNSDAQYEARRVIRKIADLSASHLAKEGGEAGTVEPIEKHRIANRLRGMFDMSMSSADDFNRLTPAGFRLLRQAHDALIAPDEAVAAPAPNPSPAAKGGDAVREALEDARNNGLIYWEPNTWRGHVNKALMLARIEAALSTPTEGPADEERFDYLSDAQARELFGTEDDDDELPDGRVRVCAGEWVRIPGGYYFDGSAGLLHPETASEACDGCAVTMSPTEGPASQTEDPDDQGRPWKDYETDTSEPSPFMQRINEEMGR